MPMPEEARLYKYFLGMLARLLLYKMYAPAIMTWTATTTKTNMPMRGAEAEITVSIVSKTASSLAEREKK